MTRFSRVAQATALVGALVLSACGGPSSSRDMYKSGNAKPSVQNTEEVTPSDPPFRKLSHRQIAAIKAFGLDKNPKPTQLIGMNYFDIERALGKPSFVRKDKGVEIWQYKDAHCILDLFLYEKSDGLKVNHTELRGPLLDSAGDLRCYKRLLTGQS